MVLARAAAVVGRVTIERSRGMCVFRRGVFVARFAAMPIRRSEGEQETM